MANFMGRLGGFVSSIISSREVPPDDTLNGQIEQDGLFSIVRDCRVHLVNAIFSGENYDEIVQSLLMLECPKLEDKYAVLKVRRLLELNNKSLQDLTYVLSGLAFIVKYARQLMREPEKRAGQWRTIHFNNNYFIKKIQPLKGYELILEQLGYTERAEHGLRFPDHQEPNKNSVAQLIADMILFRKELKEFLLGKHPHKHLLEKLIPQITRDEALSYRLSGHKIEEEVNETSGLQSSFVDFESHLQQPSSAAINVPNGDNFTSKVTQDAAKLANLEWNTPGAESVENKVETTIIPQCADPTDEVQALQELISSQEETHNAVPFSNSSSSSSKRQVCTVCGEDASLFCAECANKLLCDACNKNWHKHPTRQNHKTESVNFLNSITAESSLLYVIDPTYGVCAQKSPIHGKSGRKEQTYALDQKNEMKRSESDQLPEYVRSVSDRQRQMNESIYGSQSSIRNFPSQQLDDYQKLDYQREQQKFHFPPHSSMMESPYKDQSYLLQQQRSMYSSPQRYAAPFPAQQQPMPQQPMREYYLQQMKDQESQPGHIFPGYYPTFGSPQQFIMSHTSAHHASANRIYQPSALYYTHGNQNNSYQPAYPQPNNYNPDYSLAEGFNVVPPSGFSLDPALRNYPASHSVSLAGYYSQTQDQEGTRFLRRLMQEPDLQKKLSKCETYIEDLEIDLKELESYMNSKILEIDDFDESEAFKEMMKRKKAMMKEKKNLELFKERSFAGASSSALPLKQEQIIKQKIFYPPVLENTAVMSKKQPAPAAISDQGVNVNMSKKMAGISSKTAVEENLGSKKAHQTASIARTPVENSPEEKYGQLESGHQKETQVLVAEKSPIKIASLQSALHGLYQSSRWQCEHCTFINEAGSHVCSICGKTSDHLQLISSDDEDNLCLGDENLADVDDSKIFISTLEEKSQLLTKREEKKYEDETDPEQTQVVGQNIVGSQRQVMIEKKKAQKEYLEEQLKKSVITPTPSAEVAEVGDQNANAPHQREAYSKTLGAAMSDSYHTPPSSLDRVPVSKAKGIEKRSSSLEDTLAIYNEQKVIDSLKAEGLMLAKLVKAADLEDFGIEAVKLALTFCNAQSCSPLDWLRANWRKNVEKVMFIGADLGCHQESNTIGELTPAEAEEAYIIHQGNIKEAANYCLKQRTALFEHLSAVGDYPREEILNVMYQSGGNWTDAERLLLQSNLQPFTDRIWVQGDNSPSHFTFSDLSSPDMCHSLSTSVIGHSDFQRMMKDKKIPLERRIRLILVEGCLKSWGRAELVIKLLDSDFDNEIITLEDIVEAVRNCQDRQSAIAYLRQECQLCFTQFPMSKIRNLNFCQCKMCQDCLSNNFQVVIRERHVRLWTCPLCNMPDLNDTEVASDYLQFLTLLLQPLIDQDLQDLFETKVRDWHLQKDPNFRWCAHCAEGFLADNRGHHLRMTCPHCREKTCFNCKKEWEEQHENITCEQFALWKIDNDPTNQSVGLAKHLDENGIDCPMCKMRFSLAKGGCMHFKCPNCGFEFCSGCNEAYHQKNVCHKYKACKNQGFHCHCPRDCFSYLRDYSVETLQNLLRLNNVNFNVKPPEDQQDSRHCPVMEQKEFDMLKKDEKCGKKTVEGQAGLCELHYKEYLVYLINKFKLDPVVLMSKDQMVVLIQRYDIKVPKQRTDEASDMYMASLKKIIKEKLPLRR